MKLEAVLCYNINGNMADLICFRAPRQ